MFIVSYDIEKNKTRTDFSKFLKKYGRRLQYSVFEMKNSQRILENIKIEINHNFRKKFTKNDSVIIYGMCRSCDSKTIRYGYSVQEEQKVVYFN